MCAMKISLGLSRIDKPSGLIDPRQFSVLALVFLLIHLFSNTALAESRRCYTYTPDASMVNSDVVQAIQQALADKGYDPGLVDGVFGARTSRAIRALEKDKGLRATGEVSGISIISLGLGNHPAVTDLLQTMRWISAGDDYWVDLGRVCIFGRSQNELTGSGRWQMQPVRKRGTIPDEDKLVLNTASSAEVYQCRPIYHDIADTVGEFDSESTESKILAYADCPIPLPRVLKPTRLKHRELVEIHIDSVRGGLLIPAEKTSAGLLLGQNFCRVCPLGEFYDFTLSPNYAQNTVWIFDRANTTFSLGSTRYTAREAGARILFSESGLNMSNFEISEIQAHQSDQASETLVFEELP